MSMPTGRSEKRTPIDLAVVLSCIGETSCKERTFTENVSSRGLRAITKKKWQPGAELLIKFVGNDFQGQASVVYCQPLGNKKFAVGLALSAKAQQADD
jgi:hypothetical protein